MNIPVLRPVSYKPFVIGSGGPSGGTPLVTGSGCPSGGTSTVTGSGDPASVIISGGPSGGSGDLVCPLSFRFLISAIPH